MSDQLPGPGADEKELAELGRALGLDPTAEPPPERVAALRAAARRILGAPARRRAHRRLLLTGGIAAGVGGVAGHLGRGADGTPPTAAPTLEQIRFTGEADVMTSALVNHTWGTELLLDLTGLEPGTTYDVVFETANGEVAAGSLLAVADRSMRCRFSAAPLRAEVGAVELRGTGGTPALRAELPPVPA